MALTAVETLSQWDQSLATIRNRTENLLLVNTVRNMLALIGMVAQPQAREYRAQMVRDIAAERFADLMDQWWRLAARYSDEKVQKHPDTKALEQQADKDYQAWHRNLHVSTDINGNQLRRAMKQESTDGCTDLPEYFRILDETNMAHDHILRSAIRFGKPGALILDKVPFVRTLYTHMVRL